jgi:L1 cell adhesion molecule like protein
MTDYFPIGIDLGTTQCSVGYFSPVHDKVILIPNEFGKLTTPSYIAFTPDEILVGDDAKAQAKLNPKNTFYEIKHFIGKKSTDKSYKIDYSIYPFEIIEKENVPFFHVPQIRKLLSAEQLIALLIRKLVRNTEKYLQTKITNVIISIPAYFNDAQKVATQNACKIAGIKLDRFIEEPCAAALNLLNDTKYHNALVYDIGGGTCDISIIIIEDGIYETKAISGDTHLGGTTFDNIIAKYLTKIFCEKYSINEKLDGRAIRILKEISEQSKITLTEKEVVHIEIPKLYKDYDFEYDLNRTTFDMLCDKTFRETLKAINDALKSSKLDKDDIEKVYMIGGSSKIPKIQKIVSEYFGYSKINYELNQLFDVAKGAAIRASILFNTCYTGKLDEILYLGVTPFSLGIGLKDDEYSVLIPKHTTIPTKASKRYTTCEDCQTKIRINVYEGENPKASKNNLLGTFLIDNIRSVARGVVDIEVEFSIDNDGILYVTATDKLDYKELVRSVSVKNLSYYMDEHIIYQQTKELNQIEEFYINILYVNILKSKIRNGIEYIKCILDKKDSFAIYKNIIDKFFRDKSISESDIYQKLNEFSTWIRIYSGYEISKYQNKINYIESFRNELLNFVEKEKEYVIDTCIVKDGDYATNLMNFFIRNKKYRNIFYVHLRMNSSKYIFDID